MKGNFKMKLFKKLLVIVLCIALSLCAVPTTVIAEVKLTDPDMGTGDDIFGDIETFRPEAVDLTTRDDFGFGINFQIIRKIFSQTSFCLPYVFTRSYIRKSFDYFI